MVGLAPVKTHKFLSNTTCHKAAEEITLSCSLLGILFYLSYKVIIRNHKNCNFDYRSKGITVRILYVSEASTPKEGKEVL